MMGVGDGVTGGVAMAKEAKLVSGMPGGHPRVEVQGITIITIRISTGLHLY